MSLFDMGVENMACCGTKLALVTKEREITARNACARRIFGHRIINTHIDQRKATMPANDGPVILSMQENQSAAASDGR
jgi:hypothetical protein